MEGDLIADAGDHTRVHFLGFQNQSRMPVVYRLGDIFVLPSRGPGETWGLAVNEAMACGCPVIVTSRVGCAPDLVDRTNGRVVPPDDADALAHGLNELLASQDQLQPMRHRSAKRIKDWSIDVAAAHTADAVQAVVKCDE
jgi:glycosyltransferase involved in cell wall biosynthesis